MAVAHDADATRDKTILYGDRSVGLSSPFYARGLAGLPYNYKNANSTNTYRGGGRPLHPGTADGNVS